MQIVDWRLARAYVGKPHIFVMVAAPLRCPVLVGRTLELQELVDHRLAAARGKGSCVLLSGDAGMGKSRLLAAFRETLRGGRAAVGIGLSREFGNAPYGPFRDALAGIGGSSKLSHELSRGEQLETIGEAVSDACSRRNCVLVVEDAQWADEGTLRALLYLLPAIGSLRLLLIVTYRSHGLGEADSVAWLLPRFHRSPQTRAISLEPLPDRDVRRLIRLTLGERERLTAHDVAEIVERAEGNPFFAEELLKGTLERSPAQTGVRQLPATIRAAVLERCASLDDSTRNVLVRAAVIGRRFDTSLLASMCRESMPELIAALRRLRDLQMIEELPDTPARYAFRHELTREAIYATMLRAELEPLHHSILEALERSGATAFDLGFHAWAANDGPKSLRYNELAGDEAMRVHSYADARRCYERGVTGAKHAVVRGRLLNKAADAAACDGKGDMAASIYKMAAEAFEQTGDEQRVADLYLAMSSQARITGDTLASRTSLRRAIGRLSHGAAAARAKLTLALAFTYLDRCESDTAAELISQSNAVEPSPSHASALTYCAAVRGDLSAVRAASALYLKLCEAESAEAALQARFNLGFTLCVLGVDDEALAGFEALLPQLSERRLRSLEILTCANAALIHARAARWDAARAAIERGLSIPEATTTG
ncbi:MAG TPA: AAA family ATPase, partial [Candidatus Cybelea sp.]|nr:AAA family ATPase [Candidatus Cybelea sp.]